MDFTCNALLRNFSCNLIDWGFHELWMWSHWSTDVTSHDLQSMLLSVDENIINFHWMKSIEIIHSNGRKIIPPKFQHSPVENISAIIYQIPSCLCPPVRHLDISLSTVICKGMIKFLKRVLATHPNQFFFNFQLRKNPLKIQKKLKKFSNIYILFEYFMYEF